MSSFSISNDRLVTESGDTEEDREARALLNKFLGASVLMSGVESMMVPAGSHKEVITVTQQQPSSHQVSGIAAIVFLRVGECGLNLTCLLESYF